MYIMQLPTRKEALNFGKRQLYWGIGLQNHKTVFSHLNTHYFLFLFFRVYRMLLLGFQETLICTFLDATNVHSGTGSEFPEFNPADLRCWGVAPELMFTVQDKLVWQWIKGLMNRNLLPLCLHFFHVIMIHLVQLKKWENNVVGGWSFTLVAFICLYWDFMVRVYLI